MKKLSKGCEDWKLNQDMKDENAFVLSAQEINIHVINAFVNGTAVKYVRINYMQRTFLNVLSL